MQTTTVVIEKSTLLFALLMALGISFLMRSVGYYFESVRFDLNPPLLINYEIEKYKVTSISIAENIGSRYLITELTSLDKSKNKKKRTISIPATPQSSRIQNGSEIEFYFQKLEKKNINGKSLWRVQEGDNVIVDEQQMSDFLKTESFSNQVTAWTLGIVGISFSASAFLYARRTRKKRGQSQI